MPAPITGLRRSRIYLNTKDEDPPAWTVPVEEALKEAREAADRAKSALVQALVEVGVDADFDQGLHERRLCAVGGFPRFLERLLDRNGPGRRVFVLGVQVDAAPAEPRDGCRHESSRWIGWG